MNRITRTLLGTAVAGLLLAVPVTAFAHTGLESSTPANGAVLDAQPTQVVLGFEEELMPDAETVAINTASGESITSVKVQPEGSTVTLPWPAGLTAGDYQVAYRVVSADGHPVQGQIAFTITADAVTASNAPMASASAAASDSALPLSASQSAVPINESATAVPVNDESGSTGNPWPGLIIGIAIGVAIVVVFALVQRRRRR